MGTLQAARRVIETAERKASEISNPMDIAVVVPSLYSMRDLAQYSQSGGQFSGIQVSNHGRVMVFAGGIPLTRGEKVVGGVGVSGGSAEQDQAVAKAGAKAF
jgi:uncharacterized protein GlcG (DUF336 family)